MAPGLHARIRPPSRGQGETMNVKRFAIDVPQATLDDLYERLRRARWPDGGLEDGWKSGTDPRFLRALTEHWLSGYDWRAREAALNRFAHFRADVDGLGIHFIHERGKGERTLPVILAHGYPDSFLRFLKVIPLLTDPEAHGGDAADAFDVVVPSLPGFGFSDRPPKAGFTFR